MGLSRFHQLPLGLLFSCVLSASSTPLSKRDANYDVLGGHNFPDPSLITVDGTAYVFGTNDGAGNNVPWTSNPNFADAGGWSAPQDAFPPGDVPAFSSWAASGTVWAPDVNQLTDYDGSFAMYYGAALQSNPNVHCLGVARSGSVTGPYNDSSSAPWICPEGAGGAIDAAGFLDDDNKRYVVFKIDGPAANKGGYCNSPSNPPSTNTSLMLLQVANDGYTQLTGSVNLYNNAGESDSYNIEAPIIVKSDGTYFLFFSSGCTSANSYTTEYVTATNIWGPYSDRKTLLGTGSFGEYGPGGMDVSLDGAQAVWHSLKVSGDISKGRVLNTDTITLSGNGASLG